MVEPDAVVSSMHSLLVWPEGPWPPGHHCQFPDFVIEGADGPHPGSPSRYRHGCLLARGVRRYRVVDAEKWQAVRTFLGDYRQHGSFGTLESVLDPPAGPLSFHDLCGRNTRLGRAGGLRRKGLSVRR